MAAESRAASSGVQLAEIVAAIALAADLGLGQPLEHMLRSCLISTRFADRVGATAEERDAAYWVSLLMTAGCTAVSFELSNLIGDDIAFRSGMADVGASNFERLRYILRLAGGGRGIVGRTKVRIDLVRTKMSALELVFLGHCAVGSSLAQRLGLGELVVDSLGEIFAQWDGKGLPHGLGGNDISIATRIANIANMVEIADRNGGVAASVEMAREFSGTEFDPHLVDAWCDAAPEILDGLGAESAWERVIAGQPAGRGPLSEEELDDALEVLADYADLKSPWLSGHSRAVASLAVAAAQRVGLPQRELVSLRRAALVHDIGRNGVPNSIWDKRGPLSPAEKERVRLHAYYTDRVLRRASRLSELAQVASSAHERAAGSGYPRGVTGSAIPLPGRILAAADVYNAMLEDRPHRAPLTRGDAASELRRAAREGELDGAAVDAVLAAGGHPVRRKPTAPGGLTPREVEVLVSAARGATTSAVAAKLGITPKTAGNHIERIYAKLGVSTRAEAAMFAMQHGLVSAWDTAEQ